MSTVRNNLISWQGREIERQLKRESDYKETTGKAKAPTVKVKLVKAVRLLPHQSMIATVHVGCTEH